MLIIAILIIAGGAMTAGVAGSDSTSPDWIIRLLGLGVMAFFGMLAGLLILQVLPWIYLLKKQIWAWWLLTIVFALTTLISLIPFDTQHLKKEMLDGLFAAFIPGLTLLVLLLDNPDSWKSPSKTRRRTKRRSIRRSRRR